MEKYFIEKQYVLLKQPQYFVWLRKRQARLKTAINDMDCGFKEIVCTKKDCLELLSKVTIEITDSMRYNVFCSKPVWSHLKPIIEN